MKGKRNAYTCEKCRLTIITIDQDEGTTPFMLGCRSKKPCRGMMRSHFYRGADVDSEAPAGYAWQKPTSEEYKIASKPMKQHFDLGGLDIYPLGEAEATTEQIAHRRLN